MSATRNLLEAVRWYSLLWFLNSLLVLVLGSFGQPIWHVFWQQQGLAAGVVVLCTLAAVYHFSVVVWRVCIDCGHGQLRVATATTVVCEAAILLCRRVCSQSCATRAVPGCSEHKTFLACS